MSAAISDVANNSVKYIDQEKRCDEENKAAFYVPQKCINCQHYNILVQEDFNK